MIGDTTWHWSITISLIIISLLLQESASREEARLQELQAQKTARLQNFQDEVRQRVQAMNRIKRQQQLDKSFKAVSNHKYFMLFTTLLYASYFMNLMNGLSLNRILSNNFYSTVKMYHLIGGGVT